VVAIRIYVEGGGDRKDLQTRCRDGFRKLIERIVPRRGQLKIVACGSRDAAFRSFKLATENPEADTTYLLLVDAEEVVARNRGPWKHLVARDPWERPAAATDDSVHLMAVMTETWLLADPLALAAYYGTGFRKNVLPQAADLEGVSKKDVMDALERATKGTAKKSYAKSQGWELVGKVSPEAIRTRCPRFGRRFLDHLARLAGG
jgi:Domain of unknown function (DUF4276)